MGEIHRALVSLSNQVERLKKHNKELKEHNTLQYIRGGSMKMEVRENYGIIFKDVFNGVGFETEEGEKLSVCMRDGGYEIGTGNGKKFRVKDGELEEMGKHLTSIARTILRAAKKYKII